MGTAARAQCELAHICENIFWRRYRLCGVAIGGSLVGLFGDVSENPFPSRRAPPRVAAFYKGLSR
jgi:hypothetical protein